MTAVVRRFIEESLNKIEVAPQDFKLSGGGGGNHPEDLKWVEPRHIPAGL
jgi:hypothetical protein